MKIAGEMLELSIRSLPSLSSCMEMTICILDPPLLYEAEWNFKLSNIVSPLTSGL